MKSEHFRRQKVSEFVKQYAKTKGGKDKNNCTNGAEITQKRLHNSPFFKYKINVPAIK